jgi:hypothetical protein
MVCLPHQRLIKDDQMEYFKPCNGAYDLTVFMYRKAIIQTVGGRMLGIYVARFQRTLMNLMKYAA